MPSTTPIQNVSTQLADVKRLLSRYVSQDVMTMIVNLYDEHGDDKDIIKLRDKYIKICSKINAKAMLEVPDYQKAYKARLGVHVARKKDMSDQDYADLICKRFRELTVEPTLATLKKYAVLYYQQQYETEYEKILKKLERDESFHSKNFFEKVRELKAGDIVKSHVDSSCGDTDALLMVEKACKTYYKCKVLKPLRIAGAGNNRLLIESDIDEHGGGVRRYVPLYRYNMTSIELANDVRLSTAKRYHHRLRNIPDIMNNSDLWLVFEKVN